MRESHPAWRKYIILVWYIPALVLLQGIWLLGWWSNWAGADFLCPWLALPPRTLYISCLTEEELRKTCWETFTESFEHSYSTSNCSSWLKYLESVPTTQTRNKKNRKMQLTKHMLQGYVVSNSTPKYWSMKFFFAEAEAAPLSDSV